MNFEVGFTCGAFDLLHAGHVSMLEFCKNHCDRLIVGLHTNPAIDRESKNTPIQSTFERYVQLQACKYVDTIIPYDTEQDLVDMMGILNIQIRFLGEEYEGTEFTGYDICKQRGIGVIYTPRLHKYSSSSLRNKIKRCS
jgi:glycerol-3-phosphate cytidylyltransferase